MVKLAMPAQRDGDGFAALGVGEDEDGFNLISNGGHAT
jgi:hypothetical protein